MRPHRRQPTRLCHPWDSPGKNTGVGCHFLLQCMKVVKVKSLSRVWLFATPWTAAHQAPLSIGFSRQEYWSGLPLPSLEEVLAEGITNIGQYLLICYKFYMYWFILYSINVRRWLLLFSCPVVSDSLLPHGLQHARPSWPSPSPGVCPSSCSLHQWSHSALSSSDTLFSFCSQSFLASGTFPVSCLMARRLELHLQHRFFQ